MNTLEAGFARVNVTPMMGIPMRVTSRSVWLTAYGTNWS